MTPDERQLLSGLFDRIRGAATQTRDREAESFIGDAVKAQPYAPYLLSQTVIVQDQALRAANDRLQELEAKVQALESAQQGGGSGAGETSFLGSIGRSIFGQGSSPQPQGRASVPQTGYGQQGYGQQGSSYAPGQGQPGAGYAQQGGGFNQGQPQPGGPWGGGGQPAGGGFLKGALGAAAGVAGGVLLANSISGLFRGNQFGIGAGMPGLGGMGGYPGGGETVVNNYYENDAPNDAGFGSGGDSADFENGGLDNADFGSDDGGGFGSDDSSNV